MLVSAKEMLQKAEAGHYAVGQFNINNMEWTKAILIACEEVQSPVIIGVSEGANSYMGGYEAVIGMVKGMDKSLGITVPVALHLDHGSYEGAKRCIELGYTSVMFDGSKYEQEENLARTREIVELAHARGISVEAEAGAIGEGGAQGELADPEECRQLVETGIDFLAAGIGNIHGVYPADWEGLNFDQLTRIKEAVGHTPLVLHGGTGIPLEQIQHAIRMGVAKVNVNTELQIQFAKEIRKYIEAEKDKQPKGFDPRKVMAGSWEAITAQVEKMVKEFGTDGKAEA